MNEHAAPRLRAVILSGGSGTRLWPLSRGAHPKQFHALQGEHSMLQDTALRLRDLEGSALDAPPLLVCNDAHRFLVAEQLREIGLQSPAIVLEPAPRGTAPALTLACLEAHCDGADPVLLVMPADHAIADPVGFASKVRQAAHLAHQQDTVVTLGVRPTRAETGYGYIQRGDSQGDGAHRVHRFVEKPNAATAESYLRDDLHLWNSGMFLMRCSVWLRALGHCNPDMLKACEGAMRGARRDLDFIRPDGDAWAASPADSIDFAVMETLPHRPEWGISVHVLELDAGWSDVGAWDSLAQLLPRDEHGNAVKGDVALRDCVDNLVFSTGRLVTGIGLTGIVVVETADAVLVAPRERAQEVRQLVEQLKATGRDQGDTHRKVPRPWGWYDCLDRGERFQVKRILVKPGASLSLQLHYHRAEHWVVVKGVAQVTNGEQTYRLNENESTFIALGQKHRLSNPGTEPLEMIEVQSGIYLGEDDVVRFEDLYGRPST